MFASSRENADFWLPQMDYKANVDVRIKAELPELAKKTTYLLFGYYPSNMAFLPMMKPVELVCTIVRLATLHSANTLKARQWSICANRTDEAGRQGSQRWRCRSEPWHLGSPDPCQWTQSPWEECELGFGEVDLPGDDRYLVGCNWQEGRNHGMLAGGLQEDLGRWGVRIRAAVEVW